MIAAGSVPPLTVRNGQRSTAHGWGSKRTSYVAFSGGNRMAVTEHVIAEIRRAEPTTTVQIDTSTPGSTRINLSVRAEDVAALEGGPMHREAMSRAHHAARRALWASAAAGDEQAKEVERGN